ncbi:MAG: CDP-diacylglycerol--glycerol-3-phosphate 3-phosphatidyltransferase [Clostridia bacterium]|nr:CDP-diacylglycerol--glycerol-3-phosphate 3-phosphatidyltransferase [Clostridia bacterium]
MNLPNKLTMLRIALVPVYLVLLALGLDWLALIAFVAASLTDLFDGKIARKHNLITNFGKFMDPIADKLLTHTAFIMLCAMGRLNAAACIIFIAREFVVSGLRLVAVEQGHVIAAGMSGKIKTVLQMALAITLTILPEVLRLLSLLPALFAVVGTVLSVASFLLMLAAAVMTLYSMVEYVWQNRAVLGGAK